MRNYHHLTYSDRCQIYALKQRGLSQSCIADALGVHRSTISRELRRNSGFRGYLFNQAQGLHDRRHEYVRSLPRKMTTRMIRLIESKLQLQWSPQQISGWLRRHYPRSISHERIYKYIWADKRKGGTLYRHLRHHGKKYRKRSSDKANRGRIPGRVDIETRPDIVAHKTRLGDWEVDTIIGKGRQGALVSMVDRASKYTCIVNVPSRKAEHVTLAICNRLAKIKRHVLTLTMDNGKEFTQHHIMASRLEADTYFAKPYHAWERGLNEHTNGLIRQYFPKNTNFLTVSEEQVIHVENLLNNRPRKVLNFQTPEEVFSRLAQKNNAVAIQT